MKLKNIPLDIKKKSLKEAQNEIIDIISELETNENELEQSIEKYKRVNLLNQYIQEKFREKQSQINKVGLDKKIKNSKKTD